ncbi:MAG: hypothetical protein ABL989_03590 [Gammaproteobacteria bacterium]
MKARDTLIGLCLGLGAGLALATAAGAAAGNWLNEAVLVRLPQSEIVRHPIDNGKYYLCWTDGVSRYGMVFRRSQLDIRLRSIPRASRVSVTSLMADPTGTTPLLAPWTASDDKVCWPQ